MIPKHQTLSAITEQRIVAVIRTDNAGEAVQIVKAVLSGGIRAIELTYTIPDVQTVFSQLAEEDAILGAGTVLDAETARHALLCGAKFIVSPHFDPAIAILCNRYCIPYLPGCMTISEMTAALGAGCDIVKLFPANQFEPGFIRSVQGPLPHLRIMPTGGVGLHNISDWLSAGASAVGIGSDLTKAFQSGGKHEVHQLVSSYLSKMEKKGERL